MSHESSAQSATLQDTEAVAAQLNGPSPRTLERWRMQGLGPKFIKVGRRVLYRQSAVERWLDQQTRSHTNEPSKHTR